MTHAKTKAAPLAFNSADHAAATTEAGERPIRYPYQGSDERLATLYHLAEHPDGCTAVELLQAIAKRTGRGLTDQQLADLLANLRTDERVACEVVRGAGAGPSIKRWFAPAARQAAEVRRAAAALQAVRGGSGPAAQLG